MFTRCYWIEIEENPSNEDNDNGWRDCFGEGIKRVFIVTTAKLGTMSGEERKLLFT